MPAGPNAITYFGRSEPLRKLAGKVVTGTLDGYFKASEPFTAISFSTVYASASSVTAAGTLPSAVPSVGILIVTPSQYGSGVFATAAVQAVVATKVRRWTPTLLKPPHPMHPSRV